MEYQEIATSVVRTGFISARGCSMDCISGWHRIFGIICSWGLVSLHAKPGDLGECVHVHVYACVYSLVLGVYNGLTHAK